MGFGGKKKAAQAKEDDSSSVTSAESARGNRSGQGNPCGDENHRSENLDDPSSMGPGSSSLGGLQRLGTASRSFVHKRMVRDSLGPRFPDSERGESRQRASFLLDSAQEADARLSDTVPGAGGGGGGGGGGEYVLSGGPKRAAPQSGGTTPRNTGVTGGSPKMSNFQKTAEGKFSKTPRATLTYDGASDGDQTPRESERKRGGAGAEKNLDDDWNGQGSKMSKKKSVFNSIIFSKHRNKR